MSEGATFKVELGKIIEPERCLKGVEVVYAHPKNGYLADQLFASERLKVGNIYKIRSAIIHDWRTDVWLEGHNGAFNSVFFAEIER